MIQLYCYQQESGFIPDKSSWMLFFLRLKVVDIGHSCYVVYSEMSAIVFANDWTVGSGSPVFHNTDGSIPRH